MSIGDPSSGRIVRGALRAQRGFELGDPVEQVEDQAEGGVVEREPGAQPLDPGDRGELRRAGTTAARRRRGSASQQAEGDEPADQLGVQAARRANSSWPAAGQAGPDGYRTTSPAAVGDVGRSGGSRRGSNVETAASSSNSSPLASREPWPGTMICDLGDTGRPARRAGSACPRRAAAAAARSTSRRARSPWPRRPACRPATVAPSAASHGREPAARRRCRGRPPGTAGAGAIRTTRYRSPAGPPPLPRPPWPASRIRWPSVTPGGIVDVVACAGRRARRA